MECIEYHSPVQILDFEEEKKKLLKKQFSWAWIFFAYINDLQ